MKRYLWWFTVIAVFLIHPVSGFAQLNCSNGIFGCGIPSGTAGAPGAFFAADPTTGWFTPGTGQMRLAISGVQYFYWDTGVFQPLTDNTITLGATGNRFLSLDTSTINLGKAGSTIGTLKLSGNTSGTVTLTTGAAAGTYTMTLPTAQGVAGSLLANNGSGALSWATVNGMPLFSGTAPSIAMGDCGSTPEGTFATGATNNAGTVTVGGGTVTSCKVTFGQSFTNTPTCTITDSSTAITGDVSAVSTASFTASFSLSLGGGKLYYHCI